MKQSSDRETITITLNGEERTIPSGLTISELLAHLNLHERMVVVEYNREIVRRGRYAEVQIRAADEIELVHFVGGG